MNYKDPEDKHKLQLKLLLGDLESKPKYKLLKLLLKQLFTDQESKLKCRLKCKKLRKLFEGLEFKLKYNVIDLKEKLF